MAGGSERMTCLDVYGARVFDPPLFLTSLLLAVTDNQRRVIPPFLVFLLPAASAIWGLYSRSARLNFTFGGGGSHETPAPPPYRVSALYNELHVSSAFTSNTSKPLLLGTPEKQ